MKRTVVSAFVAAVTVVAIATPALAAAPAPAPAPNEVENTWIYGHVAQLDVQTPDAADPAANPALPAADIYLIAPIDPAHPFARGTVIPSPPAPAPIIVAVHDTVQASWHGPANCDGIDVLVGPKATPQTVLTRPDLNGGATPAYALQFGKFRLDLTNPLVITVAAQAGLLTLDRSWPGYGGTCWIAS